MGVHRIRIPDNNNIEAAPAERFSARPCSLAYIRIGRIQYPDRGIGGETWNRLTPLPTAPNFTGRDFSRPRSSLHLWGRSRNRHRFRGDFGPRYHLHYVIYTATYPTSFSKDLMMIATRSAGAPAASPAYLPACLDRRSRRPLVLGAEWMGDELRGR